MFQQVNTQHHRLQYCAGQVAADTGAGVHHTVRGGLSGALFQVHARRQGGQVADKMPQACPGQPAQGQPAVLGAAG